MVSYLDSSCSRSLEFVIFTMVRKSEVWRPKVGSVSRISPSTCQAQGLLADPCHQRHSRILPLGVALIARAAGHLNSQRFCAPGPQSSSILPKNWQLGPVFIFSNWKKLQKGDRLLTGSAIDPTRHRSALVGGVRFSALLYGLGKLQS